MTDQSKKRTSAEAAMDLVQGEMENIALAKLANQRTIKEVKEQITEEKMRPS